MDPGISPILELWFVLLYEYLGGEGRHKICDQLSKCMFMSFIF
jgi:hypothetical protein